MTPAEPSPIATCRPAPAAAPVDARAMVEAQLHMLTRLAEIGMELAEDCGRQAKAPPQDAADRLDPRQAFARVARAVRMTIALQSRLLKDLAALDRADEHAEQGRTDTRRIRLSRLVNQAVRDEVEARRAADPAAGWARGGDEEAVEDEIERLTDEGYERLTDAEDGWLEGLPFDEVIARICADLGLSPQWTARLATTVRPPPGAESEFASLSPPVSLGLVPRLQRAEERPVGSRTLDPRDRPEDGGGGRGPTDLPP